MKRNFKRAVAQARSQLDAVRMPPEAAERVLQAARRGRREPGGKRVAFVSATAGVFAVAAAAIVAFNGALLRRSPQLSMPEGLEAVAPSPDVQAHVAERDTAVEIDRGSLELRVAHWGRVVLHAGATLRRVDGGVELARGAAEFEVDKRAPGLGPTFVRTGAGTIEITGTRFFVTQGPTGGSVRLDEGSIRFHAPDGRTVALAPGQSLSWPLPPAAASAERAPSAPAPSELPAPDEPAHARAPEPQPPPRPTRKSGPVKAAPAGQTAAAPPAGDDMVDRIAALRASGRYAELADELAAAIAREPRVKTRERLSFELGSDLSYHLGDPGRACAHWEAHLRRFPSGRYTEEANDALRALHCKKEGEKEQ